MWGANWGEMIWGGGVAGAPATAIPVSAWALITLGIAIGIVGAKLANNRNIQMASITFIVLLPALAIGVGLPHTFVNGTVADAEQVNANFSALARQHVVAADSNDQVIGPVVGTDGPTVADVVISSSSGALYLLSLENRRDPLYFVNSALCSGPPHAPDRGFLFITPVLPGARLHVDGFVYAPTSPSQGFTCSQPGCNSTLGTDGICRAVDTIFVSPLEQVADFRSFSPPFRAILLNAP